MESRLHSCVGGVVGEEQVNQLLKETGIGIAKIGRVHELLDAVGGAETGISQKDRELFLYIATVGCRFNFTKGVARATVSDGIFDKQKMLDYYRKMYEESGDIRDQVHATIVCLDEGGEIGGVEKQRWGNIFMDNLGLYTGIDSCILVDQVSWEESLYMHILPVSYNPLEQLERVRQDLPRELARHSDKGPFSFVRGLSHLLAGRSGQLMLKNLRRMFKLNDEDMGKVVCHERNPNNGGDLSGEFFSTEDVLMMSLRNILLSVSTFVDFVTKGELPKVGSIQIPIELLKPKELETVVNSKIA